MKYLHRLRDEVIHNSNLRSLGKGTAKTDKSPLNLPSVSFVSAGGKDIQISNVDNSEIHIPPTGELTKVSKACEEMLSERPQSRYAFIVEDAETDPVIVALAIRGIGTCELAIPKARYDALALTQAIAGMTTVVGEQSFIHQACAGIIDPGVFRARLTPEDMADIEAGRVSVEYLRCTAKSMGRRLAAQGQPSRP